MLQVFLNFFNNHHLVNLGFVLILTNDLSFDLTLACHS